MEQAMQEITNTAVTFSIYGILFLTVLTILRILLSRTSLGKMLLGGSKREKRDRNYSEELMDRGDAYVARTHLMTPAERDVFKVLEKAYGDKYYIFCQVRVVDLIQPNARKYHPKSKEFMSLFWQLSQWHFDYVLCEKGDFKIFCALELDDKSHEKADRVKRDRIINRACEVAGIVLKRMEIKHKDSKIEVV
ncbi:DUF2726 domain-containing protein [Halomonas sp. M4R1S46]|uniref:DUF2726 domain-containing protein n=1 Tax=Halomonas sp. M4R1S46 TaxID=2982692 RepID=UPI0021E3A4E0|nr:DUF2726 domain-containing protein [Halomonas sp. M4R1S46]UYG07285.1 DUF2726 domain-containing protein [Halomonas sp. M4R1S46]